MRKVLAALLMVLILLVAAAAAEVQEGRQAVSVGDIVSFGCYEQDSDLENGPEAIEWIVLDCDEENHRVLLLSRFGLDTRPYHSEYADVTWETCSLRAWLNDEFLSAAFSGDEQAAILFTAVDNSDAQGYSGWITSGGNNTKDKIFLLSCAEISLYLDAKYMENDDGNNTASRIAPTEYAIENGAWFDDKFQTADGRPSGWWWLRSPGGLQSEAAFVTSFGSFFDDSIIDGSVVVRPAFWLNLESDIF